MISNNLLKKVILEKAISGQLIKNNNGSWKEELLGNIGDWKAGSTPSKDKNEYHIDGTIPWLLTGDLNDGDIYSVNHYITDLAYKECSLRLNPINSVLIAMYGATIGKVAINKIETTTNQACCVCICDEKKIYYKYLFYYLIAIRDNLKNKAEGAGQPNISKQKICNTKIMLPSLEEQYMIVEKIEEIFELIDKKEKNDQEKTKLKNILKEKILDSAIHGTLVENDEKISPLNEIRENVGLFDIPKNWIWCRYENIGNSGIGLTYRPDNINDDGMIVLRSSNIQDGKLDLKDIVRVGCKVNDNIIVKENDILICARNGSKRLVGKSCLLNNMTESMTYGAFMTIFRTSYYKYVYWFMQSKCYYNQLSENTNTMTINQVTQKKLNSLLIPLPPLEEQHRIVEKIEQCFELIEQL